jgi:hypothetical protein
VAKKSFLPHLQQEQQAKIPKKVKNGRKTIDQIWQSTRNKEKK